MLAVAKKTKIKHVGQKTGATQQKQKTHIARSIGPTVKKRNNKCKNKKDVNNEDTTTDATRHDPTRHDATDATTILTVLQKGSLNMPAGANILEYFVNLLL